MSFLEPKERSLLPTFVVGTSIVQLILFLLVIITFGKIDDMSRAKIPTLVELNDGTTTRIAPSKERSSKAISVFTAKTMYLLMSWNSILQPSQDNPAAQKQDKGVEVGGAKVPTATWKASFALSEDFRPTFLKELASLVPKEVFDSTTQTILQIRHLGEPEKIKEDRWRLDMVANLIVLTESGKQTSKAIPFNKTIFIRRVETPLLPERTTELQKTFYQARKDGLEIYRIQDLVQ